MQSILNPLKEIEAQGAKVEVREMRAIDAMAFFKKAAEKVGRFIHFAPQQGGGMRVELDLADKLKDAVMDSGELAEILVLKSTGKDADWLAKLSISEFLDALDAALEVNLNPEVLKKAVGVMNRLTGLFATPKGPSPSPSTT